jgi:hypothetical protein
MFDIIGDIHGHVDILSKTLKELGYYRSNGAYKHRTRKAIFVGDFVDRGNKVLESVSVVRAMVESGSALAVPGNHEYNLVCYFTPDHAGGYLRERSIKNRAQTVQTLASYRKQEEKLMDDLAWFQSLPLFIELEDFRVVHAAWIDKDVDLIRTRYPGNRMTEQLIQDSSLEDSDAFWAVEHLLKGVETDLPEGSFRDNDGHTRTRMRITWWQDPEGKTLQDMAVREKEKLAQVPFTDHQVQLGYSPDEKPVFFGHYCLPTNPELLADNVCCLDYCVYNTSRLAVYRWNGEKKLVPANLVCIRE